MSCAYECMKWTVALFNFLCVLLGLLILGIGVWAHLELEDFQKVTEYLSAPSIIFIIVGVIIFVIAFFGCCGAIRESHCMVVTYAVFLLTILVVQIAIGVWAFVISSKVNDTDVKNTITDTYRNDIFINYWTKDVDRDIVDTVQNSLSCCGIDGYTDFQVNTNGFNNTIPWSCCNNQKYVHCSSSNSFSKGCISEVVNFLKKFAVIIGGAALGVAGVELVGIIFALCLANSIRNDDRRGYRV